MNPSCFYRAAWLAAVLLSFGLAHAALADAPVRVFVASTGNDAAAGGRTSPKRTFQAAHDAVAAGGEIVVLDTAGYGSLTITKSVTVTVPPGVNGFAALSGTPDNSAAITVNAAGTDTVTLRGLVITGGDSSNQGAGVLANSFRTLRIEDCTFTRVIYGVDCNVSSPSRLIMTRTRMRTTLAGVFVQGACDAVVTDCQVDDCYYYGIFAVNDGSTSSSTVTVSRCAVSNCNRGIIMIGEGAIAYVDACTIFDNNYGIASDEFGILITRGNNSFAGNANDGSFTASVPAR